MSVDSTSSTLRDQYKSSRFSVIGDNWPPYQPKHYTSLALIHYKERNTGKASISFSKELANKGKLVSDQQEGNYSSTQLNDKYKNRRPGNIMKNISELLSSSKHTEKLILIEGAPGIGKTILSKEIAYQWAENNLLQHKKLLFLVYLRNVHSSKVQSIETLVQHVLQSEAAAADLGKYLILTSGKDLVVVLDGYDELSETDRKNSFIANLIGQSILSKCLLIITSRPSASLPLRDIADCRIEVVGFTEEDRLDYINSALPDSPEKVTALQHYLHSNPTINALCYIPLNMTILLCLSENGINYLPKTQTEMYRKFIEITVIRFLEKTSVNVSNTAVFNLKSLPHPHNVVFKELSRFAFEALKCDKLVFKLTEIQEICPSLTAIPTNWNGFGLLNSFTYVEDGIKIVTYHFLHFSIQEYMAAYHISTLPEKMQLQLLRETFWLVDYYNTWIMYVGITSGETFSLKHFLSGNPLQFFTRLFKSGISKKYLHDKIKCLHIFQCLAEAPGSDLLLSFGKLFENQEIDLSDQTLLPRDLNTLGFFLIRSINKHWEKLNLSRCNMGSAGLKILFERFVDKDTHSVVTIDRVDLSYNQLNFSTLVGLLNLMKAWKTAEFISVDDFVNDSETPCDIFQTVEHVILRSNDVVMLKTLLIGSFLFAYKLNENELLEILANAKSIKTMYLISCGCKLSTSDTIGLFNQQTLTNVHIFESYKSHKFLRAVGDAISQCDNPKLLIDNPRLSDQVADEIISSMPNSISTGIILVVSKSKIQGVINTCSLNSELSNLEMLHLIRRIRTFCSSSVPVITSWDASLQWHGNKSDGIIEAFVNALLSCNKTGCLKIGLVEKYALIACGLELKEINRIMPNQLLTSIYLHRCCISNSKLNDMMIVNFSNIFLLRLHIFDCQLESSSILSLNRFKLRELFIHSTDKKSITNGDVETILSTFHHHTSVVVVTKYTLGARNPSSQQLAMAHKLEPSVTSWKFFHCNLYNNICKLIAILFASSGLLNELKFVDCNIDNIKILSNNIKLRKLDLSRNALKATDMMVIVRALHSISSLYDLNISKNDLTEEAANYIAAVILNNDKLQRIDFSGNLLNASGMIKIAKKLQHIYSLSELNIGWNNITEEAAKDIAAVILNNDKLQRLNLSGNKLRATGIIIIAKKLQNLSSLFELNIGWNNITEEAANDIAAVILNNNDLKALNLSGNPLKTAGIVTIAKALKNISTLSEWRIDWNNVTEEAADDIASVIQNNRKLQILDICGNKFQTVGVIKIAKSLQNIFYLSELYLNSVGITEETAGNVADVIVSNNKLQRLNLSGNTLKTTGIIKIARVLKTISSLSELRIKWNNITEEAADDIAAVILKNCRKLQILDISGNRFHTDNIIKIAKSLHNVSCLSELYMNDIGITEEAADAIAAFILNSNNRLCIFELCYNELKSAAAIKIARALRKVSSLSDLSIRWNSITEEAADDIAAITLNNDQFHKLDLGYNDFKSAGIEKIVRTLQEISSLSELHIDKNNITEEAADDIAAVVQQNSKLRLLNLSDNDLKTDGIVKIARALKKISSLNGLYIGKNSITEEAADDIADLLLSNNKLQMLDLSRNYIKTAGIIKVARALQKVSSLTGLYVSENNITKEAADDIATVILNNTSLRTLDINRNKLQTIGIIKLARALQNISSLTRLCVNCNSITEEAGDQIASVVLNNSNMLQTLDLGCNDLKTAGIVKVAKALQNITSLTELYINSNGITDEAANDIAAVIQHNSNLETLDLSDNMLQVTGAKKLTQTVLKHNMCVCTIKGNLISEEERGLIATIINLTRLHSIIL